MNHMYKFIIHYNNNMTKVVYATIKSHKLKRINKKIKKPIKGTITNARSKLTEKIANIKGSIKKKKIVKKIISKKTKTVQITPTKISAKSIKNKIATIINGAAKIVPVVPPSLKYNHLADCIQGMQDFIMVQIEDEIITLFGYGDGMVNKANKGKVFKQCIRGFVNNIYAYNIKTNKWRIMMKNPIKERQGPGYVVVGEKIYFFGGYTYHPLGTKRLTALLKSGKDLPRKKACITYNDAYVFHKTNNKYTFTKLPNLPTAMCNSGVAYNSADNSIYIVGGSLYSSIGHVNMGDDDSIGSAVYKLDLNNPTKYTKIAKLPGTPRINALCSVVNNSLYIRSGIMIWKRGKKRKGTLFDFYNGVVDNWKLDLSTNKWTRLHDQKYAIQNSTHITKDNRYIYNFGGAIFPIQVSNRVPRLLKTSDIVGTKTIFMRSIRHELPSKIRLTSSIYIYDTLKDSYTMLPTGLPYYVSLPRTCGTSDVYVMGGESNYFKLGKSEYFRHPNIFIKLTI